MISVPSPPFEGTEVAASPATPPAPGGRDPSELVADFEKRHPRWKDGPVGTAEPSRVGWVVW